MTKSKKKKKNKNKSVITAQEILSGSGGFMQPACRTGKHMTEKDRPRKKIKPRDIID